MKHFIYGFLASALVASGTAFVVIAGGWVPVAAIPPEPPFVRSIIHSAFEKSVARAAQDITVPDHYMESERVLRGAYNFDAMCAGCHTPPGRDTSVQVQGMNPRPPELAELAGHRSPAEAFWVIQNGVRMTAMPAFGPSHEDDELWALVGFLDAFQTMSEADYTQITRRARKAYSGDDGHDHSHGPDSASDRHDDHHQPSDGPPQDDSNRSTGGHHHDKPGAKHEHTHEHSAAAHTTEMLVYKSPICGCCGKWIEHVEAHGFTVKVAEDNDLQAVKNQYAVPSNLRSCHTAVIGDYVIEGHVPADDIKRLLEQQPQTAGLAVAGMPVGSPGMEMGDRQDPYTVWMFDHAAKTTAFSKRGHDE